MDSCNHCYCFMCLSGFYNSKIDEGITRNFTCPYPKCETEISQKDITMWLEKEHSDKFYKNEEKFLKDAKNAIEIFK